MTQPLKVAADHSGDEEHEKADAEQQRAPLATGASGRIIGGRRGACLPPACAPEARCGDCRRAAPDSAAGTGAPAADPEPPFT